MRVQTGILVQEILVEIDWLKAGEDERKRLYVATRAVADAAGKSVEEIMDAALGRKALMGTDYMSTFRRGKIRRAYAKLIHGGIAANHIDIANGVTPDLFPLPHSDAWEQYLSEHAIHGKLRIVRFNKSMGLVERKRSQPKPDEVLKLGEAFCFHLDSDIDGYAVAFQRHKGTMHSLPLGPKGELHMQIRKGVPFMPVDEHGQPETLTESSDLGHHRFIISVAGEASQLPTPTHPPDLCEGIEAHVIRIQILH